MSQPGEYRIKLFNEIIRDRIRPKKYPWRFINDPYKVLLSEFMLHRTRASQVIPIYEDFIMGYPTAEAFYCEDEKIVFEHLRSLGLFWRIRAMISAIKQLYGKYGKIPSQYDVLVSVDGIGPYIAGAVNCFINNEPETLIDTNTVRVIGRVFGLDIGGEARRRKDVKEIIKSTTPKKNPRKYYYSVIDLAHELCNINNPKCDLCPLSEICDYFTNLTFN